MLSMSNAASAVALLREHAASTPDRPAVTFDPDPVLDGGELTLSYAELDACARRLAGRLLAVGRPGDRVLLMFPMGLDFVVAFLGCLYAGLIAVPSPLPGNYHHERRRVRAIVSNAQVSVALTDTANLAAVRDWAEQAALPGLAVSAVDAGASEPSELPELAELPELSRDTVALLQYTSGSTGDPKGVVITHGNLLANADEWRRAYGMDHTTSVGGWIPMHHDMGLMGTLLPSLFVGSRCVLMSPSVFVRQPYLWLRLIQRFGLRFSAAPNFAYELCTRRVTDEQAGQLDLSCWRVAPNGSEPVHAATLLAFAEKFAKAGFADDALLPSYGLAESTVFVSTGGRPLTVAVDVAALEAHEIRPAGDGPARDLVSCGRPVDTTIAVTDPDTGAAVPEGSVGELWLRGPSVGLGYWNNEPATEATFRARLDGEPENAYLRTGDLGALVDGQLFVVGRRKEIIIVRGRNLYPQDIEQEVRAQHPELAGSVGAAFEVTLEGAESVVLVHELRGRFDEDALVKLAAGIRQTVAREFGAPVAGVVLLKPGSVRRTTSGKIQRSAMRELLLGGALSPRYRSVVPELARRIEAAPAVAGRI